MEDVTQILSQIDSGDPKAAGKLLPLVYEELRKLAAAKMAQENPGQTLQATALVHEAYLRMVGGKSAPSYRDRRHFFASAAIAMRRILVDNARSKKTMKRGGGQQRQPLEDVPEQMPDEELIALHEALNRLQTEDPLKAQLVELRYFAGLTGDQVAEVLGISASTADRHWAFARAWLQAKVRGSSFREENS
jgi:RNA polymerase sigma factor (TIGR02999 family)